MEIALNPPTPHHPIQRLLAGGPLLDGASEHAMMQDAGLEDQPWDQIK